MRIYTRWWWGSLGILAGKKRAWFEKEGEGARGAGKEPANGRAPASGCLRLASACLASHSIVALYSNVLVRFGSLSVRKKKKEYGRFLSRQVRSLSTIYILVDCHI